MASVSEFVAKCQCCIIVKGLLTVASEHSKDTAHELREVLEKKIHEVEEGRKLGAQLQQRLVGITLKYQRTNNN